MDGWHIGRDACGTTEAHAVCDAKGRVVAFAVDYSNEPFAADLDTDHSLLIAAAPELLAELDVLISVLEVLTHDDGPKSLSRKYINHAYGVMAKAKGHKQQVPPPQRQVLTKEPTKEMIEAGAKAARKYMEETGGNSPAVIWKAMYAAAHGIKDQL